MSDQKWLQEGLSPSCTTREFSTQLENSGKGCLTPVSKTPWHYYQISLNFKKSVYKYLISLTQQEVSAPRPSVACLRTAGGLSAEAIRREKPGAGKRIHGLNLLWENQILVSTLKHSTTFLYRSPMCGYIVSFKKAFPSAIFAQVFPLYTLFLRN